MNNANHISVRHRSLVALLLFATSMILLGGCGSSTSRSSSHAAATVPPDTPARAQVRWLLAATERLPVPDAELAEHFDGKFLAQVGPARLNAALAQGGAILPGPGRIRLASIQIDQPRTMVAAVARAANPPRLTLSIAVDSRGLISGLLIKPLVAETATNWGAVEKAVRSVAPGVHMLVAETTGGTCRTIHAIDPGSPAPLGSAFKLYVLHALGDAVASGRISWEEPLTVTAAAKSLPSGELQDLPDGTRVSVEEAAAKMISISDNTATDLLIGLVGRRAIEASLPGAGMSDPVRDRPFLTTRELFLLKLDQWPGLAERYARSDEAGRRTLLSELDGRGLPALGSADGWRVPRAVDSVEWFASAEDLCRVYASLSAMAARPGLAPLGHALALNDGGLGLDPARWKTTWFKGGSEPGVLTMAYLAVTRSGRSYFVSVLADDPAAPIDEASAAPRLLSAIKAAFTLAAP